MKKAMLIFFLIFKGIIIYTQIPNRYTSEVFSSVDSILDVQFSTNIPIPQHRSHWADFLADGALFNIDESDIELTNLYMDIYVPAGDTLSKRPVILLCFGGGFVQGTRKYWSIKLLCEELAKRGFVTASIDYRLGMFIFDAGLSSRAVYRSVQDTRSAVRFFKANAENYGIDTNYIFLGGHSSGGFAALHNLYLENEAYERPCTTFDTTQVFQGLFNDVTVNIPDQGCLDCVGDNKEFNGKATAPINLAGAIGFLDLIEDGEDEPPILFHSMDDGTVPYTSGEPFSDNAAIALVGADLPIVYGSSLISQRFDNLGIINEFYSYADRGHAVHENGNTALYSDIVPGICNWLVDQYLKPQKGLFDGDDLICEDNLLQTYLYLQNDITYFDWNIIGGTILNATPYSNQIEIVWDPLAPEHAIGVFPYRYNGVPGNYEEYPVQLVNSGNNQWVGPNEGNWNDITNWSRGHLPLPCETIYFPTQVNEAIISVPENLNLQCRGIYLGQNISLKIPQSSKIISQN